MLRIAQPCARTRSAPLYEFVPFVQALFGLGDLMAQKLEGKDGIDFARLGRLTAWGAMFAPLAHGWYGLLDKMIPGQGALIVAQKVAADQLTWTIAINCLFFWT